MNNHKKMCKELYEHYKSNGICVKCGSVWADAGHTTCKDCFRKTKQYEMRSDPDGSKKRERMKKLRDERRASGLCIRCGAQTDGDHRQCKRCLDMAKERELLRRIKNRIKR